MFFDTTLVVRLRSEELQKISDFVKDDYDLDNVSHFVRIAILREIKRREKNDQTTSN